MHKKISGRLAIEIILLLAILVGGITLFMMNSINYDYLGKNYAPAKKNIAENSCKVHAYKGEVKIRGWYDKSGGEWLLIVSDEDINKLPQYDGTEEYKTKNQQIKLVDATPEMEKKLSKTSQKKPETITITGFATRCEGSPLAFASLLYKDGIFRPYLGMN